MSIDKIIKSRRSYYPVQYSGEQIDDVIIERLLENANWAPNHLHTEPWRFQVWKGEAVHRMMQQMATIYKQITPADKLSHAKIEKYSIRGDQVSHVITIAMKRNDVPNLPESEEISAVAAAVQNMWLTLEDVEGVGGYWSSGAIVYTDEFHHFLELDEDEKCLGIFYIGALKPNAPQPKGRRGDWKEKVKWVEK